MLKKILNLLFLDSSIVFFSNISSRLIAFLLFYLYAKMLGVENYGLLSLVLVFVNAIVEMSSSGLNASLIRFSAKNGSSVPYLNNLFSTSFFNLCILGFLIFSLCLIFKAQLSYFLFSSRNFESLILLSSLTIVSSLFYGQLSSFLIGIQGFKTYFVMVVGLQLTRLLIFLPIYLFSYQLSVSFVTIIIMVSNIIIYLLIYQYVDVKVRVKFYARKINVETSRFSFWMILWAVIVILQSRIDYYFISDKLSLTDVANYDVALKVISALMIVFTSYSAVLKPRFSKLQTIDLIKCEVRNTFKPVFFICIFVILTSFIFPSLVLYVYGDEYSGAMELLVIMIPSLIFYVLTLPLNNVIFAVGESRVFTYIVSVELFFKIILLNFLLPRFNLFGSGVTYSIINVTSFFLALFFYVWVIKKYENCNIRS